MWKYVKEVWKIFKLVLFVLQQFCETINKTVLSDMFSKYIHFYFRTTKTTFRYRHFKLILIFLFEF